MFSFQYIIMWNVNRLGEVNDARHLEGTKIANEHDAAIGHGERESANDGKSTFSTNAYVHTYMSTAGDQSEELPIPEEEWRIVSRSAK